MVSPISASDLDAHEQYIIDLIIVLLPDLKIVLDVIVLLLHGFLMNISQHVLHTDHLEFFTERSTKLVGITVREHVYLIPFHHFVLKGFKKFIFFFVLSSF